MNRLKISFIILISPLIMNAQNFQPALYHSFISSRMDNWKATMEAMENVYKNNKSLNILHQLTQAQYGYIAYCIGNSKNSEASNELEKAIKNVEKLIQSDSTEAEFLALKGAFYGFKVGLNPLKTVYYGPKSIDNINKSIQLDDKCPQAWMEKANATYYMPVIFGGSKTEALGLYEKSVLLFEAENNTTGNWMYLNALSVLAQGYEGNENYKSAKDTYEKILTTEPEFLWVKNELYPSLLKKLN